MTQIVWLTFCEKTQKIKKFQLKTQNVEKKKNSKYDKTQNVTKLRMWQNPKTEMGKRKRKRKKIL